MVFSNNLLLGAAGQASGYEIDQSIRFNDNDSAYLNRTFGSAGNRKTYTFSGWFKRGNILGANTTLALAVNSGGLNSDIHIQSDEKLRFRDQGNSLNLITNQVFRDPGAWFHIVASVDTTQSTASNRAKLYLNGSQITSFSTETYMAQNSEGLINSADNVEIGRNPNGSVFWDGYMAELVFIDGQALTPASFGETNDDGVWIPTNPSSLTFGSNGYYLKGATASDLGEDFSGNNNDFTSSGLATTDQMLDTPTNNYCVLSPIDKNSNVTLKDGNLVASAGGGWYHGRGTLFAPSGKWYYEWIPTAGSYAEAGWMLNVSGNDYAEEESDVATTFYRGIGAAGHGFRIGSSATDSAVTNFSLNDVIMMAIDVDTMKMWVGINGTWYNSGDPAGGTNPVGTWTDAIGQSVAPWYGLFTSTSETFNFGQRPFAYTIPTGFNSWNTANLPTPSITDGSVQFQPTLYTGDSSTDNTITGVGFEPDFVWLKARTLGTGGNHVLVDSVRGDGNSPSATKELYSNLTNAESSTNIIGFNSDGFRLLSTGSGDARFNQSGQSYVAWCWKANGTGSSNEDGSITSTVSANTTSGFSIVKWTGTGANATVGHGLGIAPQMIIIKNLADADSWVVYHEDVGATKGLTLNSTAAPTTASTFFNNTAPTSSVFSVGSGGRSNGSSDGMIAYCFAEIPGYSSIGSYTGNGSSTNGPFVYIGFKPKYILYKSTTSGTRWGILDTDRSASGGGNSVGDQLLAELSNAEANADHEIDFLSNGFKVRDGSGSVNGNGYTITYIAFAENPFGGDGVAPATAR